MPDPTAQTVALAVIGTVSVGSMVLLQIQALKQLFGDWLEGRKAIVATLLASFVAQLIVFRALEIPRSDPGFYAAFYLAVLGTFVSAVSQYAFLFKVSVRNVPPGPNAEATRVTDPTQETGEHEIVPSERVQTTRITRGGQTYAIDPSDRHH